MEAAPIPTPPAEPDMTFVKDMVDIIKNKLLFFMPFYGAFLAFLLTRHEYVSSSTNVVMQILCFACFLAGLNYAYQVVQAFWILDHIRLIYSLDKSTNGATFALMTKEGREAFQEALKKLGPIMTFEDKLFRRTMYMIYWTGALVLFDIYFGKYVFQLANKFVNWVFSVI